MKVIAAVAGLVLFIALVGLAVLEVSGLQDSIELQGGAMGVVARNFTPFVLIFLGALGFIAFLTALLSSMTKR
jgi:hypothetical protein